MDPDVQGIIDIPPSIEVQSAPSQDRGPLDTVVEDDQDEDDEYPYVAVPGQSMQQASDMGMQGQVGRCLCFLLCAEI
jgi:hypothetical protein